jgi:CubicO group peptidase (beta-lactamase class C family)
VKVIVIGVILLALGTVVGRSQTANELIARAKTLELDTPYVPPPPEDPLLYHAAGYAKVMCSAVFMTGLSPDFASENVGFFTAPLAVRGILGKPEIDAIDKAVRVTLPNGVARIAKFFGSQGCVTLPLGESAVHFTPVVVKSRLPDPANELWPMGDVLPKDPLPSEINFEKLKKAVEVAFEPAEALTAAFVVTWKGRLIAERYGDGLGVHTALEGWSMGKSITATLFGILLNKGAYTLTQPAPIPEWETPGDPRAKIRIQDLLHMSSGLRTRAPSDPDYDRSGPYPDHLFLYTGGIDSYHYAATRPQQWPPNAVGRYRNTDSVLISYLIRLAVEKSGEEYLSFPQRALFDKLGIRTIQLATDPFGNFLGQGYDVGCGRDWARLGNLYLQDGVWNGERILPEGYAKFVSTPAPAWIADRRPIYGAGFWINGAGQYPVPQDSYYMAGVGGQITMIVPSRDLVVVRLGHYKGAAAGTVAFKNALKLLMDAVPGQN